MAESTARYLESFKALTDRSEPEWLHGLRREAIDRFATLGIPDRRNEDFKHTPLGKVLDRDLDLDTPPDVGATGLDLPTLNGSAGRVVFVDGRFAASVSSLPEGVRVASLADELRSTRDGVPAWLGKCADFSGRSLLALNTAMMTDGAVITADAGASPSGPIHLVFAHSGAADGREIHLRNVVVAESGSKFTVVEHHVGEDVDAVVNVVTEIAVEAGARVHHVKLQEAGLSSSHLSSVEVVVGRDGRFDQHTISTGAALGRTEMRVELAGVGAECDLAGLQLGRGSQHMDQLTLVTHAEPHGTSRQVYRGVLDDRAKGIFNGLVLVRPDAQKTSADQASKNLVLSETAEAHARPQLDISADDVKCSHGSTIGALDADALFYLRSRGIAMEEARQLLIHAFAAEVLDSLEDEVLRGEAERMIRGWFR